MKKKALLEYGTHPSFPAMTVPSSNLMNSEVVMASKWLVERKTEIENEFEAKAKELYDMAVTTTRLNSAIKSFKPIIGKVYFLYERTAGDEFVSHIEPHTWTPSTQPYKYNGMFKLNSNSIWVRVKSTDGLHDEKDWRHWGQ